MGLECISHRDDGYPVLRLPGWIGVRARRFGGQGVDGSIARGERVFLLLGARADILSRPRGMASATMSAPQFTAPDDLNAVDHHSSPAGAVIDSTGRRSGASLRRKPGKNRGRPCGSSRPA